MEDLQTTNASLSGLSTSNNISYTVLVTPLVAGPVSIQLPADKTWNIGGNGNLASNAINYDYDPVAPLVNSVAVPANGYYKAGQTLNFTVQFSEVVNVKRNRSFAAPGHW